MPEKSDHVRGEGTPPTEGPSVAKGSGVAGLREAGRGPRGDRPGSATPATTRQPTAADSDVAGLGEAGGKSQGLRPGSGTLATTPAGEYLHDRLREAEQDYCRALARCARRASAKRVHRLRTEARRLLTLLKLVNTVTAADEVARACHAVTRQLKALGELRDVHVQLEHLRGLRQVHPEVKPVCRALRRRERRLAVADRRIRHRGRQRRRLAAVTRIVARIARDTDDATWQTAVSNSLREHAEAVLAARPAVAAGPSIHRARIALRDFRFAVELTGGFAQGLRPDHLESLHRCQSLMGDIHDLELMLAHIVAFGGDHPKMRARLEPLFRFFGRRRAELASEYRDAEEATFDPGHGLVVQVREVFEEGEDERLKAEGGRRNGRRSQTGGAPSGSFADAQDDIENPRGPHGAERSPRPTGKRGSAGTPRLTLGSHENPQSAIANSQSTESRRKAPPTAAKRGKPKAEGGKRRAQR